MPMAGWIFERPGQPKAEVIVTGFVNNVLDDVAVLQVLRHEEGENFRQTAGVTSPRLPGLEITYLMGAF